MEPPSSFEPGLVIQRSNELNKAVATKRVIDGSSGKYFLTFIKFSSSNCLQVYNFVPIATLLTVSTNLLVRFFLVIMGICRMSNFKRTCFCLFSFKATMNNTDSQNSITSYCFKFLAHFSNVHLSCQNVRFCLIKCGQPLQG